MVGIATAPDNTLAVNGSADKPGGGLWGVFSDRRLKTVNGNFTSGLEQVLKIKPVRYRYKDENTLGIKDHSPLERSESSRRGKRHRAQVPLAIVGVSEKPSRDYKSSFLIKEEFLTNQDDVRA